MGRSATSVAKSHHDLLHQLIHLASLARESPKPNIPARKRRLMMQTVNHADGPLNPGLIFDMVQAHQRTAALKAAIDLDVFRAVGEGPGDVASIAKQCSASERGIRILCDFLTINGVLVKKDGHYLHTPSSAAFLDPRSPACMASVAQF